MTGHELKRWRQRLGWTQARAARELGITTTHFRRLEQDALDIRRVVELATRWLSQSHAQTQTPKVKPKVNPQSQTQS